MTPRFDINFTTFERNILPLSLSRAFCVAVTFSSNNDRLTVFFFSFVCKSNENLLRLRL